MSQRPTFAKRDAARVWRRRGDTALRVVAAIPGGYAVASLWAMALARLLPFGAAQATFAATIVAFAICAGTAMWAFAARSGWRAVWTILLAGIVAAAITAASVHAWGRV